MKTLTRLRLARLRAGKTQIEAAIKTGIPQTLISQYENEYRQPPPNHLAILGHYYGISEDELYRIVRESKLEKNTPCNAG